MKHLALIIILLFAVMGHIYTQTDTGAVYKKLETKKYYDVNLSISRAEEGWYIYKANEKEVSKSTYNKYSSTKENYGKCCPCILQKYNEYEILIEEAVRCGDCLLGWYKDYYLNGKLKLEGNYKYVMPTKDGPPCNIPHGQWTYFNKKGDTSYLEFWDNGEFLKQVPEQNTIEMWAVELRLDDYEFDKFDRFDKKAIPIDQIKNLKITPKYKNSHTNAKITVTVTFSTETPPYKTITKKINIESFQDIDVASILSEAEIEQGKVIDFRLYVDCNGYWIGYFLKAKT